jgi:hypothetical protein
MHVALNVYVFVGLTLLGTAFALWKGDMPARIAGVVNLIDVVGVLGIMLITQAQVGEALQLAADFAWAVGLLFLVVRYAYRWLGVTMLLQAVQFSLHAYYLVMEIPKDRFHAWVNNTDNFGILICICAGTALAIRRRVQFRREEAERIARRQGLQARA